LFFKEAVAINGALIYFSTKGMNDGRRMILFIKNKFPKVIVEAREVEITSSLQHTFIRIVDENKESYLYDGVGTVEHKPYFGPENEAPRHLQNSKPDMINKYL
jgi:CRISPR/Cas system-associated exonuclease Cas4 (RecB family)